MTWKNPRDEPPPLNQIVLILYDREWKNGPVYDLASVDDFGHWDNYLQGSTYFGLRPELIVAWHPLPEKP